MPRIRDLGINHIPMYMQGEGGSRDWPGPCGEGSPTNVPRPGQPPGPCGEGSPTNRPDFVECNPDSPSCDPKRSTPPPSPPGPKTEAAGFPVEAIAQLRQQLDHRLGV